MSINSVSLFSQYNFKPTGDPDADLKKLGMTKEEAQSIFGDPQKPDNSSLFSQYGFQPTGDPDADLKKLGMTKEEAQSIFGDPQKPDSILDDYYDSTDDTQNDNPLNLNPQEQKLYEQGIPIDIIKKGDEAIRKYAQDHGIELEKPQQ